MELLQQKVAGGFTVLQIGALAAALVVGYLVIRAVTKKPPAGDSLRARMTCGVCGWTGMVSKHKSRCSQCGGTVLTPAAPGPGRAR